jgi:tRNA (guanine-N7-)-methyltransferase
MQNLKENLQKSGKWINPYILKIETHSDKILYNDASPAPELFADKTLQVMRQYRGTIVELGSGSGKHLVALAENNPDHAIFGFELRFKRAVKTVEKAELKALSNLYVFRTTADNLSRLFPEATIDQLHLNFPDPWEKDRWKKNRMLTAEKLSKIARHMKIGGTFSFKTDHTGYFEDGLKIFQESSEFTLLRVNRDLHAEQPNQRKERSASLSSDNITTEFEQLFLSKGMPIYHLLGQRT